MKKIQLRAVQYLLIVACFVALLLTTLSLVVNKTNVQAAATKPVIDMTKTAYTEVSLNDAGAAKYFYENNGSVENGGTRRLCDANGHFIIKVVLPKDTTYFSMFLMNHQTGNVFIAEENNFTGVEPLTYTPDWRATIDLSIFLPEGDTENKEIYFKFADSTPIDGNGFLIQHLEFSHNGTLDVETSTTLLTKNVTAGEVAAAAEMTTFPQTLKSGGDYQAGGQFRNYDGLGAGTKVFDKTNSKYDVYKFTYSDKAVALNFDARLNCNYLLSFASSLPAETDAEYIKNSNWQHLSVGDTKDTTGGAYKMLDISSLMANNPNRTIYVRISDAADVGGGGGWMFHLKLLEKQKIDAPVIKMGENEVADISQFGKGEINLSSIINVISVDTAVSVEFAVKDKNNATITLIDNKFIPSLLGEYTVTVVATDANETSATATFKIDVKENVVTSIAMKSSPTKISYVAGQDLDLTGAKITVTYADGTTTEEDITAAMVTGYDKTKTGEQTLTVTFEGKTATFKVTVAPKDADGCNSSTAFGGTLLMVISLAFCALVLKKKKA